MSEAHVPEKERRMYREFLREATIHDRRVQFCRIARTFSPLLRRKLLYHVTQHLICQVYYFNIGDTPQTLLASIASGLTPLFFSRQEPLDDLRHDLCMMDRGTVAHGQQVLVPPSFFHEDFIISRRWKMAVKTTSLTYTLVLVLTRDALEESLRSYPATERRVRVCAGKMAFCGAMRLIAAAYQGRAAPFDEGAVLSLSDAFDKVFGEDVPPLRSSTRGSVAQSPSWFSA
mmetsp:Transcript_28166/g.76268  ORF Transcript_28166/g.76268 Transcript_28166/m.76268 type:complete len:230 (-) Transcript_28166:104-793(-)